MTHRQPAAFGSPVFSHPCPRLLSSIGRNPPDLRPPPQPRPISGLPAAPPNLQPPPQPRQISGRRETCPRCGLRSARRLEARPGPAGLAAASNRAETAHLPYRHLPFYRAPATKFAQHRENTPKMSIFLLAGRTFSRHDMPHRSSRKPNTHVRAFGSVRGSDDTHVSPMIYPRAS